MLSYALVLLLMLLVSVETSSCSFRSEKETCAPNLENEVRPYFLAFKERVKKDLKGKVPEEFVESVFCAKELRFNPEVMLKSLTWKEVKLPYHQFLIPERVERAFRFLLEYHSLLTAVEEKFKVDKEVIVSILLIETDLGTKTGKHPVVNTYFSLALAGNETFFSRYVDREPEVDLTNETTRQRYRRRADWAYRELLYTLEYLYSHNAEPFSLRGSVFGAFGYPQFVPKSFFIYGYDWDGDGKVNLFDFPDALASIANYLAKEGYRQSASWEDKLKAIMKYNKSEPYARTVLNLAKILKSKWEESVQSSQRVED